MPKSRPSSAWRAACVRLAAIATVSTAGGPTASAAEPGPVDIMLCNYARCAAENASFVQTLPELAGKSVDLDLLFDVPIGTGDYNASCIDKNPYLDAPEEYFFVPGRLDSCDVSNGIVFRLSPDNYSFAQSESFSLVIRIEGRFRVRPEGPIPIYALVPAP